MMEIAVPNHLCADYISFIYKFGYTICDIYRTKTLTKIVLEVDHKFIDLVRNGLLGHIIIVPRARNDVKMTVSIGHHGDRNDLYAFLS